MSVSYLLAPYFLTYLFAFELTTGILRYGIYRYRCQ